GALLRGRFAASMLFESASTGHGDHCSGYCSGYLLRWAWIGLLREMVGCQIPTASYRMRSCTNTPGIPSKQRVGGSNPSGRATFSMVRPGDIGYRTYRTHRLHLWAERVFEWFEHPGLQIEVS